MKYRPPSFTREWLRSVIHYDPLVGLFMWRRRSGRAFVGNFSTKRDSYGYIQVMIEKRLYSAHRLAWFYVFGEWPELEIDHRNGIRSDNRLANLRVAMREQNQQNRALGANNKSGFLGVYYDAATGSWVAQITAFGKQKRLGSRGTPEAAYTLYLSAKAVDHSFQPQPRYASNDNTPNVKAA